MAQQQCFAFEARIAFAFFVHHVGQVEDAGVYLRSIHVDRRFGIEITKGDSTVVNPHFVQGNGQ
ncbi:hypothetical protein D3C71_2170650 [compost metagenome]